MKNNSERNEFDEEALLKAEAEKINNAKFDFRPPTEDFQESLKMKILAARREKSKNKMKKLLEAMRLPVNFRYVAPALTLAAMLVIGLVATSSVPFEETGLIYKTTRKITRALVPDFIESEIVKVDDWKYSYSGEGFLNKLMAPLGSTSFRSTALMEGNLGFSAGGAKDVNSFRENIKNNYLPLPTDITYEGLFYDYYFDTGKQEECAKLFCPSYSYAVSSDPFSKTPEYFLSVGLNSGTKEADFQRKKLNLAVVLDISGSMSSPFNRYYYDRFGNQIEVKEGDFNKTKMEIANESVVALLSHLKDDDRFGMVVFSDDAFLAKPMRLVKETDIEALKRHILDLEPTNGTYMEAGMKKGAELFGEFLSANQNEYENRIIFLTDAMPNIGDTSREGLLGLTKTNSESKLYSTFIGIGVDFNTELVEAITKIRGANYYSVHSSSEFQQRMDDEFEYMVTPLVFDLKLNLEAEGYKIEKVYGSPEANEATGELMKVNTLFPSKVKEGETRGGLVLLKLKKISDSGNLRLKVSYQDRSGKMDSGEAEIKIENNPEFFSNNGIRKGVLLARYATLVKNWIVDERASYSEPRLLLPCVTEETGIVDRCTRPLGEWERQSAPLKVSQHYKDLFRQFREYFTSERSVIGDSVLDKELEVLNKLINY